MVCEMSPSQGQSPLTQPPLRYQDTTRFSRVMKYTTLDIRAFMRDGISSYLIDGDSCDVSLPNRSLSIPVWQSLCVDSPVNDIDAFEDEAS